MRKLSVLVLLSVLGLLTGCQRMQHLVREDTCDAKAPYHAARVSAPIRSPEGLPELNTRNGLKIPETGGLPPMAAPVKGCLDQAPKFYADAQPPAAKARPLGVADLANGSGGPGKQP
jgi:hypothetical protein